jgi:hypothetical protein
LLYVILFLYSLICHYKHETWSWHAYRFALGFLRKSGCDIWVHRKRAQKYIHEKARKPERVSEGASFWLSFSLLYHTCLLYSNPRTGLDIRRCQPCFCLRKQITEIIVWLEFGWTRLSSAPGRKQYGLLVGICPDYSGFCNPSAYFLFFRVQFRVRLPWRVRDWIHNEIANSSVQQRRNTSFLSFFTVFALHQLIPVLNEKPTKFLHWF